MRRALTALLLISMPAIASDFDQLKSLAGRWEADRQGKTLRVDYRVISRDSVLMEAWQPGTRGETATVFHRDGERLLATHYCAQGNQPRLALTSHRDGSFVFDFVDATNLAAGQAHLHHLELSPKPDGSLERVETYRENGKDDTSRVLLHRSAAER